MALWDQKDGTLLFLFDPAGTPGAGVDAAAGIFGLSAAEKACLELMVAGRSRNEIAELRAVSPETVKTQAARILQKMSCRRLSEVIARAILLDPPFDTG
jgi:DNA-binding CsgD family transcriptional regulator